MKLSNEAVMDFLRNKEANILNLRFIKQRSENTCWAACYEMVDNWRKIQRNSCEYVRLQTRDCKVACYRPTGACDKPRPVTKVTSDWWTLGYNNTREYDYNLDENEIRSAIKKKRPIHAFIKFRGRATGHYILILGIERKEFTADALIAIMDPESGYTTRSFGELFKWGNWQLTWVVH